MILMMVFVKIVVNRCFCKRLSNSRVMEKVKNIQGMDKTTCQKVKIKLMMILL